MYFGRSVIAGYRASGSEPVPDWVVRRDDDRSDRLTGLYHLKRQPPAFSTLCGLEKSGWHRWPPAMARPPEGMCCQKCMEIATRMILEGRIEIH
jgi:hypothetical protein